jgi:hypothetical protein
MPVLVDIALVGVTIPLDAVQKGSSVGVLSLQQCSANHVQEVEL